MIKRWRVDKQGGVVEKGKCLMWRSVILGGVLLALICTAQAANRALLIGVGDYASSEVNDLPGIDLDIGMARELAMLMGFKRDEIAVLQDAKATYHNIYQQFQTWLQDGVGPDDRLFIYYSGHGTYQPDRNGDETDHRDEVLMPHDSSRARGNGGSHLVNVITDDELHQWLTALPTPNITVMVDACHSGTVTRSAMAPSERFGIDEWTAKFYDWGWREADWAQAKSETDKPKSQDMPARSVGISDVLTLSAAQDSQTSIATRRGSLYTLVVRDILRRAASAGTPLTPVELTEKATEAIRRELQRSPGRVFRPNVTGEAEKLTRPIPIAITQGEHGPLWQALQAMSSAAQSPLPLFLAKDRYQFGERLTLTVGVPQPGYLNVLNIGPDDSAEVIFPNAHQENNRVAAGDFPIPTATMPFDLIVGPPAGDTMVVAFLSSAPLNLYHDGLGAGSRSTYREPSPFGLGQLTDLTLPSRSSGTLASGMRIITLCETIEACHRFSAP